MSSPTPRDLAYRALAAVANDHHEDITTLNEVIDETHQVMQRFLKLGYSETTAATLTDIATHRWDNS